MPRKAAARNANMEDLVSHVFIMGRVMRNRMQNHAARGKCSFLELEALRYVKEAGRPHMREIAGNFRVSPPAATLMIDGLVKGKLLERVFDPKDRRTVRVSITPRGKRLLEQGIARKVKGIKRMFGSLTPAERTQFISIIRKIIKNNA